MPLTFAHPALILPLTKLSKRWLSLTGLVAGSMVPDFEYFLRMRVSSHYSHTVPGLFWFDVPLGLLLFLLYQQVVKDKLIDHLPLWFGQRLAGFKGRAMPYSARYLIVVIISIGIGAASHLLWDGFTHPLGYFVHHIHFLRHKIHLWQYPVYYYSILQQVSTFIGLLFILLVIAYLPADKTVKSRPIGKYWLIATVTAIIVLLARLLSGLDLRAYGDWIVSAISGGLLGIIVASVLTPVKAPQLIPMA